MLTWGFWLLFAVGLCGAAECGMRLAARLRHRRAVRRLHDYAVPRRTR